MGLTRRSAKPLFTGSNPVVASKYSRARLSRPCGLRAPNGPRTIVEALRDAGGSIFGPRDPVTPIAVCQVRPRELRVVAARAQPRPEKVVRLAGEGSEAGLTTVKPAI